jgi:hypothetical protein
MHGQQNIKSRICNLVNVAQMRKRKMHAKFLVASSKGKRKRGRTTITIKGIIPKDHTEKW